MYSFIEVGEDRRQRECAPHTHANTQTHTHTHTHTHTARGHTDGDARGEQNKTTANKMSRS